MTMTFTAAAQSNVDETSTDVAADIAAIRSGALERASLLARCLDGADEASVGGWYEYVDAVMDAAIWARVEPSADADAWNVYVWPEGRGEDGFCAAVAHSQAEAWRIARRIGAAQIEHDGEIDVVD